MKCPECGSRHLEVNGDCSYTETTDDGEYWEPPTYFGREAIMAICLDCLCETEVEEFFEEGEGN